ncbi:MAG: DUF389 domain-containing protein [Luteolibacter sp.]
MVVLIIRNSNEARPLLELALKAAAGLERKLSIIVTGEPYNDGLNPVADHDEKWIRELATETVHEVLVCGGAHRYQTVEKHLHKTPPYLLIAGKHLNSKSETSDTKFSRHLYDSLHCQTFLVRYGEQSRDGEPTDTPSPQRPILVAAGHGPHTRRALRLAYAIAGEKTVAFHITPDVDRASSEFAENKLNKIIKKAGIKPEDIQQRIVLGTDLSTALRNEVTEGFEGEKYDMIIVGCSETQSLREKLFGTIPEKLVNQTDGLNIGVIRAARPTGHRIRESLGRLIRVRVPQLERSERLALFEEVEYKSRWSFDFAALMTLAALVAGLGLLANSAAVVIGAMLIAPLMMPLIGSGLALAQGNTPLFKKSTLAVISGFLCALLAGIFLGALARFFHIPLTGELAARGEPTLLDLGVAFVSGIAASYCIARPTLTGALAGVSIAAALVPPIVTAGICLVTREVSVAKGASLLFGTNVVAVIFGAALNFSLGGIHGQGKAGEFGRRLMFVLALACLGLAVPLSSVLLNKIPQLESNTSIISMAKAEKLITEHLPPNTVLVSATRKLKDSTAHYNLIVESDSPLTLSDKETLTKALNPSKPKAKFESKVRLETRLVLD